MGKGIGENNSQHLCDIIVEGMQKNKANDIVVLDLREIGSAVCDFFVICSGDSSTQVDGITDNVIKDDNNLYIIVGGAEFCDLIPKKYIIYQHSSLLIKLRI